MKLSHFFAEMKRRSVFRVIAVYGAVSFVILQVADIAFPSLGLPDWALSLVLVLLLIGFPVAIVFAWAFEMTPDGPQRTDAADPREIAGIVASPARARWPMGLAALVGAGLLGVGTWWILQPEDAATRNYDSIAVLPFANLGGDVEDEYLGDGLAEELLNALVRIEGLKVASRTSAFAFKGSTVDVRTIADSLNVQAVLEGSVRRSGDDKIRVTAQLIAGEDGYHLWSEVYDRPHGDLLQIQDELTEQIVEALAVRLSGNEHPHTASQATDNAMAYDYYLQGRYFWNKRTGPDMEIAIGLFEKAIEADSSFAPAYAAIADAYVVPSGWSLGIQESLDMAERYARLALDIDPTIAQAHAALGLVYLQRDLDFARSEDSFVRVLELDSQYATGHQWFSEQLIATGRHEEAIATVRRGEALDPTEIIRWNVARILYLAGRYDDALAKLRENAVLDGEETMDPLMGALTFISKGDYTALFEHFSSAAPPALVAMAEDSMRAMEEGPEGAWFRRTFAGFLDELAAPIPELNRGWPSLVAWLEAEPDTVWARLEALDPKQAKDRYTWLNVLADAAFDPLRADPRFLETHNRFGVTGIRLED